MKQVRLKNQDYLIVVYILVSILFATFLGEFISTQIPMLSSMLDKVAQLIPSIKKLELNSDFPLVTRRYLSLMWLLSPVFIVGFIKIKNGVTINEGFYSKSPIRYLLLLISLSVICFYFLYSLIAHEVAAGAPRDKVSELVFARKLLYQINTNRLALGLIGGAIFSLQALLISYLVLTINKLIRIQG